MKVRLWTHSYHLRKAGVHFVYLYILYYQVKILIVENCSIYDIMCSKYGELCKKGSGAVIEINLLQAQAGLHRGELGGQLVADEAEHLPLLPLEQ